MVRIRQVLDDCIEYLRDPDDPYRQTGETRRLGLTVRLVAAHERLLRPPPSLSPPPSQPVLVSLNVCVLGVPWHMCDVCVPSRRNGGNREPVCRAARTCHRRRRRTADCGCGRLRKENKRCGSIGAHHQSIHCELDPLKYA